MKKIILILIFSTFAFAMPVYEFTDNNVFNAMYSLFINVAIVIVPVFGALALIRS